MSILLTADLHFTDNPRDEYRWKLFPWLCEQVRKHKISDVFVLGDVTDAKDRHSAKLVNRLARCADDLAQQTELIFLKGNHDYIDVDEPFLGFMGLVKHVTYVSRPRSYELASGERVLLLPSTKDWEAEWFPSGQSQDEFDQYRYIFTHQTYDGAVSESGRALRGVPSDVWNFYDGEVYSGDIHVPQRIGKRIEYVGAPYRIRFGDKFEPRVLLIHDGGKTTDLHFPCLMKHTVDLHAKDDTLLALKKAGVVEGDQVKLRCHLPRSAYDEWPKRRQALIDDCRSIGVELFGPELIAVAEVRQRPRLSDSGALSAKDILVQHCERNKLEDGMVKAGLGMLVEASEEKLS